MRLPIRFAAAIAGGLALAACSLPLAPAPASTRTATPDQAVSLPSPSTVPRRTPSRTPALLLSPTGSTARQALQTPAPAVTPPPRPIGLPQGRVTYVVDGDTLDLVLEGNAQRVRLIGVDTPETVDPRRAVQCYGQEASAHAKALVDNQVVWVEGDPSQADRDVYDRLLRYVWLPDGSMLNLSLIVDGFGLEYLYAAKYKYHDVFVRAQQSARDAQRGLWSPLACAGGRPFATVSPASPAETRVRVATSTPAGAPSASPSATRTRAPASPTFGALGATPATTPAPALAIVSVTSPVSQGGTAVVVVQTLPSAPCSLKVSYKSFVGGEESLGFKSSEPSGRVSWRWTVPRDAPTGIGTITVTCAGISKGAAITVE